MSEWGLLLRRGGKSRSILFERGNVGSRSLWLRQKEMKLYEEGKGETSQITQSLDGKGEHSRSIKSSEKKGGERRDQSVALGKREEK